MEIEPEGAAVATMRPAAMWPHVEKVGRVEIPATGPIVVSDFAFGAGDPGEALLAALAWAKGRIVEAERTFRRVAE